LPSGRHIPGSSGEITAQLRTVNGKAVITPVGQQPGLGEGTYLGPAPLPDGWLATIGVPPKGQRTPSGYQVVVVDADGRTVCRRGRCRRCTPPRAGLRLPAVVGAAAAGRGRDRPAWDRSRPEAL
jgi:hypothetical protein